MENKNKFFYKNRIKCFYPDAGKYGTNRVKNDEESPSIQEISDKWKEESKDLRNPQEESDQS